MPHIQYILLGLIVAGTLTAAIVVYLLFRLRYSDKDFLPARRLISSIAKLTTMLVLLIGAVFSMGIILLGPTLRTPIAELELTRLENLLDERLPDKKLLDTWQQTLDQDLTGRDIPVQPQVSARGRADIWPTYLAIGTLVVGGMILLLTNV